LQSIDKSRNRKRIPAIEDGLVDIPPERSLRGFAGAAG
jgi:hypothetical protein